MRHDILEQPAHEIVGQRQRLRAGIERPGLHEVPIAGQVHDVVIELNVRLDDLAGARIVDVRPRCVLGGGRQPSNHRVARVFRAPARILLRRRRVLRDDRVLEPRGLECRLPVFNPFFQPRHPLARRRRIDPVHDRLHRLGQRRARIFLFEAVPHDVAAARRAVLVLPVIHLRDRKVPDALVEQPRLHRLLGQQHHAVMHQDAGAARAHRRSAAPASGRRARRWRGTAADAGAAARAIDERLRRLDLDVRRKRRRAFDERARRVEGAAADPLADAEFGDVGGEQTRRVDDGGVVLAERLHVERHDDAVVVRRIDRLRDRQLRIRDDVVRDVLEEDAVVAAHPFHDAIAGRLPAVALTERGLRDLGDPEELLTELLFRNLVVHAIAKPMHGEDAVIRLDVFRDHPIVRARLRIAGLAAGATAGGLVLFLGLAAWRLVRRSRTRRVLQTDGPRGCRLARRRLCRSGHAPHESERTSDRKGPHGFILRVSDRARRTLYSGRGRACSAQGRNSAQGGASSAPTSDRRGLWKYSSDLVPTTPAGTHS